MVFITTLLTGIFTGLLQSAFAVISVAFLIGAAFIAAALIGPVSFLSLGVSILGFNIGLFMLLGGHLVFGGPRSTP